VPWRIHGSGSADSHSYLVLDAVASLLLAQRLMLAAVFAFAAVGKMFSARESVLALPIANVLPGSAAIRFAAWRAVSLVELLLAAWLVWGVGVRFAACLTVAFSAGAFAYLRWALRHHPVSPCGCFGAAGAPPSRRTLGRPSLMCAAAALLVVWPDQRGAIPSLAAAACLVEIGFITACSPRTTERVHLSLYALRDRFQHAKRRVLGRDKREALQAIQANDLWTRALRRLEGAPLFKRCWRKGPWWLAEYVGEAGSGQHVTLVAARYSNVQPPWIRVALLDEARVEARGANAVIAQWDSLSELRHVDAGVKQRAQLESNS
jgi:hypothetical protein